MQYTEYTKLINRLPDDGRHIVASYDDQNIVVYQGFNKDIAIRAIKDGRFSSPFSFKRLSWIKTNFTWMMYRSEWGIQEEYILAIYFKREFFERVLQKAVYTQFFADKYESTKEWKKALKESDVRIQWDPDHNPQGKSLKRRAIQLGLEGETLRDYAQKSIVKIVDMSNFVREQRNIALSGNYEKLKVPEERVYVPVNEDTCSYLSLS